MPPGPLPHGSCTKARRRRPSERSTWRRRGAHAGQQRSRQVRPSTSAASAGRGSARDGRHLQQLTAAVRQPPQPALHAGSATARGAADDRSPRSPETAHQEAGCLRPACSQPRPGRPGRRVSPARAFHLGRTRPVRCSDEPAPAISSTTAASGPPGSSLAVTVGAEDHHGTGVQRALQEAQQLQTARSAHCRSSSTTSSGFPSEQVGQRRGHGLEHAEARVLRPADGAVERRAGRRADAAQRGAPGQEG
jgi:hypothetical protein